MKKIITTVIVAAFALTGIYLFWQECLSATAGVTRGAAPISLENAGNFWLGTWASIKTEKTGNFNVLLQQDGDNISGNVKISGSNLTKGGDISGTIKGDKLEFGFVKDKKGELKYLGTISDNIMSGTWDLPVIKDHGTWQAMKKERESSGG